MEQEVNKEDINISARDGFSLSATLYKANTPSPRIVIINSATAVPRQFYQRYASALVKAGFTVITYDYRGINDSRPKSLRGFKMRMRDWALLDMQGVLDWAQAVLKPERLFLIGHSFGGQAAGMLENTSRIDGMITLSAQSGHWRFQGAEQKLAVLFHSYITLPVISSLIGYMPWSWFGAIDMPKGAAIEWAGWCRDREYLLGDDSLPLERYQSFSAPVLAYSIDDDKWGTEKSVDAMMKAYPNRERRHILPSDHKIKSLGHMGFFRSSAQPFWDDTINWLNAI